jgi:hypothetical protein
MALALFAVLTLFYLEKDIKLGASRRIGEIEVFVQPVATYYLIGRG